MIKSISLTLLRIILISLSLSRVVTHLTISFVLTTKIVAAIIAILAVF